MPVEPRGPHLPIDVAFISYKGSTIIIYRENEPTRFEKLMEAVDMEVSEEEVPMLPEGFQPNGFPAFAWPSTYEPKVVTQAFGINPENYAYWGLPGHEGIDMRAPLGQEIIAVWDGEVVRVEFHNAYGNSIRLKHLIAFPGGEVVEYESIYAHFAQPSELRVGDKVAQGEVLGIADSTGNSTGSHLHFGVKQFNHPELRPPMDVKFPYDLIDPTVFFEWLEYKE